MIELEILPQAFSVCKIGTPGDIDWRGLCFVGRTDQELSLVCETDRVPACTLAREDGWRGLRVRGVLDFSLTGVLSRLSGVLAEAEVGIFAVSTYNTDYIFTKSQPFPRALQALGRAGYIIREVHCNGDQ